MVLLLTLWAKMICIEFGNPLQYEKKKQGKKVGFGQGTILGWTFRERLPKPNTPKFESKSKVAVQQEDIPVVFFLDICIYGGSVSFAIYNPCAIFNTTSHI